MIPTTPDYPSRRGTVFDVFNVFWVDRQGTGIPAPPVNLHNRVLEDGQNRVIEDGSNRVTNNVIPN